MKINLAKSAGFCFGVKRAIDIALTSAKINKNVYMLGDIVHNDAVVKMVSEAGIKKIASLVRGKGKNLLISAHGNSLNTINKAKALGFEIIDATCPMVKEIHTIAQKMDKKGFKVIVIGDKKHDEVRGIIGQIKNKPLVIDNINDVRLTTIKHIKKAAIIVQSTQNIEKVNKILELLQEYIKDLKFFNTICRTTRVRQEEIKTMPRQNDVMIIIGSKHSANTQRLFEISKSLNPKSYCVQSKSELKLAWFKDARSTGIAAGASTPDEITQEIIKHIRKITAK